MMPSSNQHFSLKWNNYSNHITNAFDSLRSQEDLVDVTLCCEGRKIRAHKVLLSACSIYFRDIFKENPCQHPVIVFKNVKHDDLLALIEFMYQGEVSVQQDSLPSFLTTAEMLAVQGLTVSNDSQPMRESMSTTTFSSNLQAATSIGTTTTTTTAQAPKQMLPNLNEGKVEIRSNSYTLASPMSISSITENVASPTNLSSNKIRSISNILKSESTAESVPLKKRRLSEDERGPIEETIGSFIESADDLPQHHNITVEDDEEEISLLQLLPNPQYVKRFTISVPPANDVICTGEQWTINDCYDQIHYGSDTAPWSHQEINYLLNLYESHMDHLRFDYNKNNFWHIMATLMQSHGFARNEQDCRETWKNLCRSIRLNDDNRYDVNGFACYYATRIKRVLNTFTAHCLAKTRRSSYLVRDISTRTHHDEITDEIMV